MHNNQLHKGIFYALPISLVLWAGILSIVLRAIQ